MPKVVIDKSLQRRESGGFAFPLGVYPVEAMKPAAGYTCEFEAADSGETFGLQGDFSEDWEEWPDRFMYDIAISATRLRAITRLLLSLLPGRAFPILDILGSDAYREIDPYIAYELVGVEKMHDAVRMYGDWLFEDGLVGFGAMSVEPFVYLFVDEHKLVTVRVELDLKERLEKILSAFDLQPIAEIRGPDAAEHEHRSVLVTPIDRPEYLSGEDILHRLRYAWRLQLNIDATTNLDDAGEDLGVTGWRVLVRCLAEEDGPDLYAEGLTTADSLDALESLVTEAAEAAAPEGQTWLEIEIMASDRLLPEDFKEALGRDVDMTASRMHALQWIKPGRGGGENGEGESDAPSG